MTLPGLLLDSLMLWEISCRHSQEIYLLACLPATLQTGITWAITCSSEWELMSMSCSTCCVRCFLAPLIMRALTKL